MPFDQADIDAMFSDPLTTPAIYKSKAGRTADIDVIFSTEYSPTQVGDTVFSNDNPSAQCKKTDVFDASKGAVLILNDLMDDETGDQILDTSGSPIVATGVETFNIIEVHRDAEGFIDLQLSVD